MSGGDGFIFEGKKQVKILICGGGIAGLAAMIALREAGHDLHLVERAPVWQTTGAGLHLPGNARPLLDSLGTRTAVEQAAASFDRLTYCRANGQKLFCLDVRKQGWPDFMALSRQAFHDILLSRLEGAVMQTGGVAEKVSADGHVVFSDGRTDDFDLVVVAEGMSAPTRQSVFGAEHRPVDTGFRCWRWVCDPGFAEKIPQFIMGRGVVVLLMPLEQGKTYVFFSVYDPAAEFTDLSTAQFEQLLAQFSPTLSHGLLNSLAGQNSHEAPLQQMVMDNWVKKRVVLIGDAAHGTLPTLAQGAAQAMKDAVVLASVLDKSGDEKRLSDALAQFQQIRTPEAHWVQAQSLKRMGLVRLEGAAAVFCRNTALKVLGPKILASGWEPLITGRFSGGFSRG